MTTTDPRADPHAVPPAVPPHTEQDAPAPRVRTEPAHRLSPSPRGGRGWRITVTLIASLVVGLLLLGLAGMSLTSWAINRGYQDVPATYELGTPDSITLTSHVAEVTVMPSSEVDQVTVALVDPGATALPPDSATARAQVSIEEGATGIVLDVRQPGVNRFAGLLEEHRDVLLVVPTRHTMALDITSNVGGIDASGEFTSLTVRSDVGDIRLRGVSAPEGLTATGGVGGIDVATDGSIPAGITLTSDMGDVSLALPTDAGGEVTITSDVGEVDVTAPGEARRTVVATSEVGTVTVDPQVADAAGESVGTLTVTTSVGDIRVSR